MDAESWTKVQSFFGKEAAAEWPYPFVASTIAVTSVLVTNLRPISAESHLMVITIT